MKRIWNSMSSAPSTGKKFICWNGVDQFIVNAPKGHAMGDWHKQGKKWYGAITVIIPEPICWRDLPENPTEDELTAL